MNFMIIIVTSLLILSTFLIPKYPPRPRRRKVYARGVDMDPVKAALREYELS